MKLRQTNLRVSRRANGAFCRYRQLLPLVGKSCGHAGVISGDNIQHEHEREGVATRERKNGSRDQGKAEPRPAALGRATPRHQQTTSIAFRHTHTRCHLRMNLGSCTRARG